MNNTPLTQHYQQILGDTKPWFVSDVKLDAEKQTIEIGLSLPPDAVWGCPACKSRMHIKEWRERSWRHLDSCQFKTVLKAKVPVVECQEHGSQTVQVPWAEGKSRFTLFFERLAIEVLLACNSRIQLLVQKSCGYRNRDRLKTDILFHFGGLNLDPLPVQ